jgi:hypothetical protein
MLRDLENFRFSKVKIEHTCDTQANFTAGAAALTCGNKNCLHFQIAVKMSDFLPAIFDE